MSEVYSLTAFCFHLVYHLVGEMFLGAWRVYTSVLVNPFDKTSKIAQANTKSILDQLPSIDRFIFNHALPDKVFDHGRLNQFFFDKVLARAFQLPVPANWVDDLKKRLLTNYNGPVSLNDSSHANSKPVVTYLSRQEAIHRKLSTEAHDELSAGLKVLEEEELAEVNIETFIDSDTKDDQVAKLSRTTIFVTLHGDGLTNLIWMTPDAYNRSAIYEIQQPCMFFDDYAIISEALGIDHWIIGGRDPELE
ncbi:hypothetical protein QFC21_002587 [Naganishia friedmannii]|uniref:Uncharacterized protein n=1 Tax=Naganishia friedmannii TaxID=89922 RepID=A0ACC2VUP6_9TREE|nr:hypothetical protein QFC21_002587 [Naganishia friedmannii]